MAYQVHYGPATAFESNHKKRRSRKNSIGIYLVLLAAALVLFWPAAGKTVRALLLPWSDAAEAAFTQAFEADGIGAALTAFCDQVLTDAGV